MATFPELSSVAGATLEVSTTLPATTDAAGYGAIATLDFDEVGYILTAGIPTESRTFNETKILNGTTFLVRGSATMSPVDMETTFDTTDAGQAVIRANKDATTKLTWQMTFPDGLQAWWVGYANGYSADFQNVDDPLKSKFQTIPIFDVDGVGVVYSA